MLKKAICSVLVQDFKNWELIIVDDASTDDTTAVVKGFKSSRITYLKNLENSHKGASRNNGIKIAKGKFITFLDDDDYYLPNHLNEIYKGIKSKKEKIGLYYTDIRYLRGNEEKIRHVPSIDNTQNKIEFILQPWTAVGAPQAIISNSILEVEYFDETIEIGQDTELFVRIADQHELFHIQTHTYVALYHNDNSANLKYNSGLKRLKGLKKIFKNKHFSRQISFKLKIYMYSYCYRRMSDHYEFIGDRRKTLNSALKSLVYYPFDKDLKIKLTQIIYSLPFLGVKIKNLYRHTKKNGK